MNKREKILLAAILGLGVLYLGQGQFDSRYRQPRKTKLDRLDALSQQVLDQQVAFAAAAKKQQEYAGWTGRALPAEGGVATSGFIGYLQQLLADAKVENPQVQPGSARKLGDAGRIVPFTVKMTGTLEDFAGVMQRLDRSPGLQLVRGLALQPVTKDRKIQTYEAALTVEALSAADAPAATAEQMTQRLQGEDDFAPDPRYALLARKAPFQPTELEELEVEEVAAKDKDDRDNYVVYNTGSKDGESRVRIRNVKGDERLSLAPGDDLSIDGMKARVVEVSSRGVRLEVDDEVGFVPTGGTLKEWAKVEPAGNG